MVLTDQRSRVVARLAEFFLKCIKRAGFLLRLT